MSGTVYPFGAGARFERRGLRDDVHEQVSDMLLSAQIEPGSRLSIDAIARDLNVSQTPVREALIQLERTGLVIRELHKGYRMAPPMSDAQVEELYDARLVLEVGAAQLAAAEAGVVGPLLRAAVAEQQRVAERIEESFVGGEVPFDLAREYFAVDWEFHRLIFQSTHNSFLIDMSESISTRVHRMRQSVETGLRDTADALIEHGRIADAFAHSAEAAGEAMRDHLEKVRLRSRRDAVDGAGDLHDNVEDRVGR